MIDGTTKVFAVFKGYLAWDPKKQEWFHDEWLTQICENQWTALRLLEEFAEGHPFDNPTENRVTRYFEKRKNAFTRGREVDAGCTDMCEKEWIRYAEFVVTY